MSMVGQSLQEAKNKSFLPSPGMIYLFAAALAIRLWFNFFTNHVNAYDSSDAAEYLRFATALSKLNFTAPVFGPEWKEFAISGPAFPFFLYFTSFFAFAPFEAARSEVFLIAQSLVSALTVVFIAQTGKSLWDLKTGYWAGALATIYPGFIVNSGRLYSETFATFLEMAAITILVNYMLKKSNSALLFLLGALLVLLQLTRSSMILFTAAVLILVAISNFSKLRWQQSLKAVALVLTGAILTLTPWFVFQKAAFNKTTPIVDRVGAYNLFIGTNTDTQGFLTYPYPDGRGIEAKSFLQLAGEAFKKSPSRSLKLALDKPARLYKFPWNDFRTSIGPINFQWQVLIHQIVVVLALCGFCLALGLAAHDGEECKLKPRFALLLILLLNFPYLAFITVPRYNLLAMPALLIFAAAGLTTLVYLLKNYPLAKAPKIAGIAALFLLVYLRDDLRAPLSFGGDTATLYIIQGADRLVRSIASSAAVVIMFSALYRSISLLESNKYLARSATVLCSLAALLLCAVPQRANGRVGEGIVTLARAGESLNGQIYPAQKLKSDDKSQWFVLLDNDRGQILNKQFALSINGDEIKSAPLPSLSALDDWNYLKTSSPSTSYLDCAYIFDCLSRPAAISNSQLRQWFVIPVDAQQIKKAEKIGYIDIDIKQKSNEPSTFFCAAPGSKQGTRLIPSTTIYSWEKAFYGVENDAGFTDTRLDQLVPLRKAKWTISYQGNSENLSEDVNVRLIKMNAASNHPSEAISALADLPVPAELIKENQQLITVSTSFATDLKPDSAPDFFDKEPVAPEIYLTYEKAGVVNKLPLPCMPALTNKSAPVAMSFLLDLAKVRGSEFAIHGRFPDKNCRIVISARGLNCHPLFSPQELF